MIGAIIIAISFGVGMFLLYYKNIAVVAYISILIFIIYFIFSIAGIGANYIPHEYEIKASGNQLYYITEEGPKKIKRKADIVATNQPQVSYIIEIADNRWLFPYGNKHHIMIPINDVDNF